MIESATHDPTPVPDRDHDAVLKNKKPQPDTGPGKIKIFLRLMGYIFNAKGQLALAALFTIIGTTLNLIIPVLVGIAINNYITDNDADGLLRIVLLMLGAAIGAWLALSIEGWLMANIAQQTMYVLRRDLFTHIQSLSLRYYDQQAAGDLMSRLVNDLGPIERFFALRLASINQALFTVVLVTVIMFVIDMWLAIAVLITTPIMFGGILLLGRSAGPAFRELQQGLGDLNGYQEETISGERLIMAYGQEESAVASYEQLSLTTMKQDANANFLSRIAYPITLFLENLDYAIVATAGGWQAIRGAVEVGTVATFLLYARQFSQPASSLAHAYSVILQAIASAERIFDVLDTKPEIIDRPGAAILPPVQGTVRFDDVNFSYLPGKPVLRGNTFDVKPGQMIGLCGTTGAGKSTIIELLTRFYEIQGGEISVDDRDIEAVQLATLRRQTGVVPQTPFIFSDTVVANIRYGRLNATDEECITAAKLANADEFILRLPDGYQTVLAERGSNLSHGQQQLLTIARAILADPHLLILDEATSSIDTRTEERIQEALLRLMEGKTSFVIAHRLSTIRTADQIIALDNGRIVETGTHDELMSKRGFYYDLYSKQFSAELLQK